MSEEKQSNLIGEYLPQYSSYKAIVGKVLKECPETRGNDSLLIKKVVEHCFKYELNPPSYETITRARRKFNEEGRFLPDNQTIEQRRKKEQFFREAGKEGLL
jgi:hypothetical protein